MDQTAVAGFASGVGAVQRKGVSGPRSCLLFIVGKRVSRSRPGRAHAGGRRR